MDPIETLMNEHGLILQFLDHLSVAAEKIEDGQRPPREVFETGVEFARTFADTFHHFKEEHVLFVQLAQKREGAIDGQIEALRYQHERGRGLVAAMADAIDGYADGDSTKTAELLQSIGAYTSLLRHHIHNEDHDFYPMARQEMTDAELAGLAEEFDKEHKRHGADTFERCHKMVVDMGSLLVHMA